MGRLGVPTYSFLCRCYITFSTRMSKKESNSSDNDPFNIQHFSKTLFRPKGISSPADSNLKTVVYWFKPDCLRLDDNPGLNNAVSSAHEFKLMFQAIFILDPWFGNKFADRNDYGHNVMRFLFECLVDLDKSLKKYYGINLRVYVGMPDDIIRSLIVYWNVVKVTFQTCKMFPEIIAYEDSLIQQCRSNKVWAEGYYSHSLYDPTDFVHLCKNQIPALFDKFELFVKNRNLGHPRAPVDFLKTLPHFESGSGASTTWDGIEFSMLYKYGFPMLDELYKSEWVGGESEAQKMLKMLLLKKCKDDTTDPFDMLVNKEAFSPYIRFGCISIKRLYYTLIANKPNCPARFDQKINGLLRREHSIVLGHFAHELDSVEDNILCIPVPWEHNLSYITAFRKGVTGFPWIDAVIRQIIQEGWACLDARNSIATFLTRGYLWISWVEGIKFFQEFMLDFELSVSCICWMHCAKSFIGDEDDDFDPIEEGIKLDPKGRFIKKYVPELANYPVEHIHKPWELPVIEQKITRCIIGVHYPKPIVEPKPWCCSKRSAVSSSLKQPQLTCDSAV